MTQLHNHTRKGFVAYPREEGTIISNPSESLIKLVKKMEANKRVDKSKLKADRDKYFKDDKLD